MVVRPTSSVKSCACRWRSLSALVGVAICLEALAEPSRLRLSRVSVPVEGGSPLSGLRVAHMSDLHVGGAGWRVGMLERAIEVCNRMQVDLVAITGDLIGSADGVPHAVGLLSRLREDVPRLAVLGNHDHVHGKRSLEALLDGMVRLGIVVLRNDAVVVSSRRARLWVAGVDDGYSMRDDLGRVRARVRSAGLPKILLSHYPDVAEQVRPGEFSLVLAGHSHGGQIRAPVVAALASNLHARTRYLRGLYQVNGNPLYVSAGLGVSGVPFRFLNVPELTTITFEPMQDFGGGG